MNEPTNLPGAPFGDDTDEALSALVDGELDAFAHDHGLTEEAARARLESWPASEARLAELDHVRASMQSPLPPIDDVTRRRLVRNAATAASAHPKPARSRRWIAVTAVAAAGVVALVGIGAAISATGGDGGTSSSESAGSSAARVAPLRGDVGDLGDVTSAAALRALLDRREAGDDTPTGDAAEANDATSSTISPSAQSAAGGTPDVPPLSGADAALAVEACAQQLAGDREVTFSGTGTYAGAPVTIVGISEGGRTIVFVVSSTDCTNVLASISR